MTEKLTVLVTGATGQQGGSVARALRERGHGVRALTRKPNGEAAKALASTGVEVVAGDFADPASLIAAAKGVDTVFLMGNSWEAGPEAEATHGIKAVDALKEAGVGHVIYSSVDSADRNTGIPHFDSKYAVEKRLTDSGLRYTISAPAAFMENHVAPWSIGSFLQGQLAFGLPAKRKLHQIAVADVGKFAAVLAERRDAVFGKRINIAGDNISGEEMVAVLARVTGRPFRYAEIPLAILREQNAEAAIMLEWFDRVGYAADTEGLRRDYPEVGWHSFEDWARESDWSILDQQPVGEERRALV